MEKKINIERKREERERENDINFEKMKNYTKSMAHITSHTQSTRIVVRKKKNHYTRQFVSGKEGTRGGTGLERKAFATRECEVGGWLKTRRVSVI